MNRQSVFAMPSHSAKVPTVTCSLVVTRAGNSQVLLLRNGASAGLPKVEIPEWERAAPHLTGLIRQDWGTRTICLFQASLEEGRNGSLDGRYYVVEVLDADWTPRAEMIWLPVVEIGHRDLQPSTDFDVLAFVVSQAAAYDIDPAGFFASSGYFERLCVWVASRLSHHGLTLSDEWTQYNMGPSFCLIRFETNRSDVWFKAVGEPNLREYAITITLSECYPGYLPRVLGSHPEWHGWLMCDGNGRHPDALCDLNSWQIVARSLAALQIESAADSETLLSVGCLDLRLGYLYVLMDDFFEAIAHLMRLQASSHPKPLTDLELSITKLQLKRSLQSLEDVGLPDTLVHLDLNAGNILVRSDRAVFLDWVQAALAYPCLALNILWLWCSDSDPTSRSGQPPFWRHIAEFGKHLFHETVSFALAVLPQLSQQ